MLIPALDAVEEHIYLNIGASLGNGSGTSRLNATGITTIGAWLNSNKNYSLVTNKRHRILHIVGGGNGVDNRTGDASVPWTNTSSEYFYSIYYESDQRHTALGLAVKHAKIYNIKTTRLSMGSTAADAEHDYISPDISLSDATTLNMLTVTVGGGANNVVGRFHLYNPKIIFSGIGGRLVDCSATNHTEMRFFGGTIYAGSHSVNQYLNNILTNSGVVVKFYNTSIFRAAQANKFVTYNSGYTQGTKVPRFELYNVATNANSFDAASNFTQSGVIYGQGVDELYSDAAAANYLVPSSSLLYSSGTDLSVNAEYGYTNYSPWPIGLMPAEPLAGAIQVVTMSSASGNKTINLGETITFTVTGDIGTTTGTCVLKDYTGMWQTNLTVTGWDNTTKVITAFLPTTADFRYGDDDNILYLTRNDTEPFNPLTDVTLLVPSGVSVINGNEPSSASNSIFKDALSLPVGMYQIRWTDPSDTGAVLNAYGEVVSTNSAGTIYVTIWSSQDNSTSDEFVFTMATSTFEGVVNTTFNLSISIGIGI